MIMKKEYIAPQQFEMIVETGHILAGSGEITTNDKDEAIVTPGKNTYEGNDWASRRNSAWDDEENEDF